jgi:hypothetical protein
MINLKEILLTEVRDKWEMYSEKLEKKGMSMHAKLMKKNLRTFDEDDARTVSSKEVATKLSKDPLIKKIKGLDVISTDYNRWKIMDLWIDSVDHEGFPSLGLKVATRSLDPDTNKDVLGKTSSVFGSAISYTDD